MCGSHLSQISTIETNSKFKDILESTAQAKRCYAEFTAEIRAADSTLRQHITTEIAAGHDSAQRELREESSRTRQDFTSEINLTRGLIIRQGRATRLASVKHKADLKQCVQLEHMKTRSILKNEVQVGRLEEIEAARWSQFVCSLKFPEMNARRSQIVDPHCHTFEWIFNDKIDRPWDSFKEFLENPASIFWINGKAGSGKSSLMRFISEHGKCQQMLDLWSSPKKTLILRWYFWNSGTEFQRSLRGALCSLTHQLLSQVQASGSSLHEICGSLNPGTLSKESVSDWSVTELVQIFEATLHSVQAFVIIFLDGLDEFNYDEDVSPLLDLVEEVTTQPHVKACVSSRPEKYLISRLESYPQLKLQDLTANDIRELVIDRLRSSTSDWKDSEIQRLAEKVRERASGVFLWVRLVTDQLARGLLHGDSQQILTERLEKLPPKMESLYEHMWRSLNGDEDLESYRQQAANCLAFYKIFPMTVFDLAVALDDDSQHKFIGRNHQPSDLKPLLKMCTGMEDLLKTRCAGLLEISGSFKSSSKTTLVPLTEEFSDNDTLIQCLIQNCKLEINFIHRSARDFLLETEKGRQILKHCAWPNKDVITRVVNAYLQRKILGLSPSFDGHSRSSSMHIDLNRLVSVIFDVEDRQPNTSKWQYSLLNTIDSVYRTTADAERRVRLSEWQENWYYFSSEQSGYFIDFWGSTAAKISDSCFKLVLSHWPNDVVASTYFLASVCWAPSIEVVSPRNLHAMQIFLCHGANPNSNCMYTHQDHGQCTPWLRFLWLASRTADYSGLEAQLVCTIEKFLASGGELSATATIAWQYSGGEFDSFEALMTSTFHEIGEVVFEVNAAYLLEKICSRIRDPVVSSELQRILESTVSIRIVTLVRGGNGRWFTVKPDDAVYFLETILIPVAPEVEYKDLAAYAVKATTNGVEVKPRALLAARGLTRVCPRLKTFGGLAHLRRASAMFQAKYTISWLSSTWWTMGISSVFANGFSEIPSSGGKPTRFNLLEDMCSNLSSFYELFGPLYECAAETDELYPILSEIWEELAEFRKKEAAKLAGQDLAVFYEELDELCQLFRLHGLEHALAATMDVDI
ncbi:uncharacterized protein A1O9_00669 [Exophiala aquamarina CBS 119918]|uniref:Uncharacterized protein n=1 Tax=Exophiala aquamarina CBS 119918 TaxID=1182545 RepID=A0A072PS59_9EURO|nr:uncharacterized protein A1O9_00669 [Exophiala aquamarina CBS 119918]KEF62696.1 hypothetical protein A1O9_00669 [Exophiala aquamarina CBS 119918]